MAIIDAERNFERIPEPYCDICGEMAENCVCPVCDVCGVQGDPGCIDVHMSIDKWRRIILK